MNRRFLLKSAIGIAAGAALTTACTSGGGGGTTPTSGPGDKAKAVSGLKTRIGTKAESQGPFTVDGAKKGGTVRLLEGADFSTLDPQRVYASTQGLASMLITRRLTAYKRVGDELILVGDIATDTGTASDGNKTWTYTLKEAVRFEDGTEVTSAHIKDGVERLCQEDVTDGPTYIPIWLYGEDYSGSTPDDSAIEIPDDRTIVFHLKEPQADFPFACAYPVTAPVLKKAVEKDDFGRFPTSTGPYRITEHDDTRMVLERNEHWAAETDPIRAQYPDTFAFTFGVQSLQSSQQLAAADEAVFSTANVVDASYLSKLATYKDRVLSERGITLRYMGINCKRITDLQVRKALMTAFPKSGVRSVFGGPEYGDIATGVLTPATLGYQKHDVYGVPEAGDPAAAKKILEKAGKLGEKVVIAYAQSDQWEQAILLVKDALTKAGFEVVAKQLETTTYFTEIGKVDKKYDLFVGGWTPDWATGAGTIPTAFHGDLVYDGSANYFNYDNAEVNAEIDRIKAEVTDPGEAAQAWVALDKKLMEDAVLIPWAYEAKTYLLGGEIGGAYVGMSPTGCNPAHVYVKS